MKKTFLLLLLIVPFTSFAQNQFIIKGKIKNIQAPAKVYLDYRRVGERSHWDSTVVVNGEFEFKGIIADTVVASIMIDYKGVNLDDIWGKKDVDGKLIYLTGGVTYLTGNDSARNATLSGTKINVDYNNYTTLVKTASSDSIKAILDRKFITNNPNSFISFDQALKDLGRLNFNASESEILFNSLTQNVRNNKEAIAYKKYLYTLKKVVVGSIAPEFNLPDTAGNNTTLSSFKGKYVLIDFWASWCHPCREANPEVVKLYNKCKHKNFTILGVSSDRPSNKTAWIKAIHTDRLNWAQVLDLKGDVVKLYAVTSIPDNVLIDPTGKIIARNLDEMGLEKKLEEIFGTM
jgi:peroxiredoxin